MLEPKSVAPVDDIGWDAVAAGFDAFGDAEFGHFWGFEPEEEEAAAVALCLCAEDEFFVGARRECCLDGKGGFLSE